MELVYKKKRIVCISTQSSQTTLEFILVTKKKTVRIDMSALIVINKKTKSRCLKYCLEMIKRINEEKKINEDIKIKISLFWKKN